MAIRQYLDLSTAHVRQSTGDLLDRWCNGQSAPIICEHHGRTEHYGWWVHVPLDDSWHGISWPGVPQELRFLMAHARQLGCSWILLDRDADPLSGWPTFEWGASDEAA